MLVFRRASSLYGRSAAVAAIQPRIGSNQRWFADDASKAAATPAAGGESPAATTSTTKPEEPVPTAPRKGGRDEFGKLTMTNTQCFFEVAAGGRKLGRIVFGLYEDDFPKTCENFIKLCEGSNQVSSTGTKLEYKNSNFHRVIPGFMVQGGDITLGNGRGGESIYGPRFEDEGFGLSFKKPFMLAMANAGPNTNGSQFFITTIPTPWLDRIHVAFGEVISGRTVVQEIEKLGSKNGAVKEKITIIDCGKV